MHSHRAVVEAHDADGDDEHEGEDGIEVVGDGADEELDALALIALHLAGVIGHGGGPRGYGSDHTYRSGGGVDQVGELSAGDLVAVGDGLHDRTDGQAVEVVVDEDKHAQHEGGEHSAGAGLDVLCGPASEGLGAAGLIDQSDDDAQLDKEDEHACRTADGVDEAVAGDGVYRLQRVELGSQQRAYDDTHDQRGINFLGDQGQSDSDDRRYQRPEGAGLGACHGCEDEHADDSDDRHAQDDFLGFCHLFSLQNIF